MPESQVLPSSSPRAARRGIAPLLVLLVATALLRCAVMAGQWDQLSRDPDAYRLIAENLREHGVFSRSLAEGPIEPTAFRPPLYPLLLAATTWQGRVRPWSVAIVHLLLGILTVAATLELARHWDLGVWSILAAAMVACDPILLSQSAQVMTETLATLLAVVSLLVLTRSLSKPALSGCLLSGMTLGLATLCRPTFLIWSLLIVVYASYYFGRWLGLRRTARLMAGLIVGVLLTLSPWVLRNQQALGKPILATTHGGYTLLLGNNPHYYQHLRTDPWGSVWDARELAPMIAEPSAYENRRPVPPTVGPRVEIAADHRLYELARETMRHQPGMFAYASLVRIAHLWTPLPQATDSRESALRTGARWSVAAWYVAVYTLTLVGLGTLGRRVSVPPWIWGLLCVLAFTLVHSVYWSNMRMRAPLMPVVYLVFAIGCRQAYERVRRHKSFIGR